MFAAPNSFITGGIPTFPFSISSDTANLDLRTAALAAGWNGTSKPVCTINSGVLVYSTSTGSYALTISGSFPAGVELINNGTILGKGGAGGRGAQPGACGACFAGYSYRGDPGSNGGPALYVTTAVKINNVNRIAGGGGGGGGGYGDSFAASGGGGGGGTGTGAGGARGPCNNNFQVSQDGSAGTNTAGGAGGQQGIASGPGGCKGGTFQYGRDGGDGGGYGSSGSTDSSSNVGGGSGGAAVVGNSNITWIAFGTRNGSIS